MCDSAPMQASEAKQTFLSMVADRKLALGEVTASTAMDLMLRFYAERRATDVVGLDEDGDMVLYEWGVFDWGDGPRFQFGLTRQFVLGGEVGDDAISQLALVLHYEASAEATALGRGHRWCHSPAELDDFRTFVEMSSAAAFVSDRTPTRVELMYEHI